MSQYKVVYEFYAGMGENAIHEQLIDSKEQLVEMLNNVFKTDIMITSMKIYKLRPDGTRSHMLDEVPEYTPEQITQMYNAKKDLINALNEQHKLNLPPDINASIVPSTTMSFEKFKG